MYQPIHPHIPETPTKKLKLLTALSFAGVVFLALAVIILSLQLITQFKKTNNKQSQIDSISAVLEKSTEALLKANRDLIVQNLLPQLDSFSSQCDGGNDNGALFTPLSKTPIESYNVFLVECRKNISAGKSQPRIIVFHVNNDGTKELTYGAIDSEPLCISNKLPVANKLATKLLIPVCQSN
ncbi:MAG: hypothetical protein WCJ60_03540 [bacterium]